MKTKRRNNISTEAATLHKDALVWDSHGCMPQTIDRLSGAIEQLSRYREGGVDICHINIGDAYQPLESLTRMAAFMRHWIKAHASDYRLATSVADIEEAKANGQLAVAFDIEGGHAVQDQLSLLDLFYDLGVRWMLLSYNKTNALAGGCHDEDPGLSDRGRAFVAEMARLGMITCCSHTGYKTVMDVFDVASNPVIFSHSNARTLRDHPRTCPMN
ncbi:MAG: membrane dipeptidase [Pseudomonadota bacterium]